MAVALVLLLLLGLLWFTGVLPMPFNRDFTSSESSEDANVVPCLAEGTPSVELSTITVTVYNASNRTGLASKVSGELSGHGVTVSDQLNWGGEEPDAPIVIYSSQNALPQAYTLARMFPNATVRLDGTTDTEILDVVLGSHYTEMRPEGELAELGAGQELTNPENCVVVER